MKRVSVVPITQDDKTFRDFEDLPGTLAVRSSGTLEANTVGYNAEARLGGERRAEDGAADLSWRHRREQARAFAGRHRWCRAKCSHSRPGSAPCWPRRSGSIPGARC